MINVIWQTLNNNKSVLSSETNGQYEYITNVVLKDIDYTEYFDNKQYNIFLDNSVIIYSAMHSDISREMSDYLHKYKSLGLKYILLHLSNEFLNHNCEYYSDAEHVFRFYFDEKIKHSNVTTLPLGFVSGYMNKNNEINLSDKRDVLITFIGQVKSDRQILIDSVSHIDNKFLHLTNSWDCPTGLSSDKVIEIYKRTLFVPCPKGWYHPDSLRLFEALEWGCIPIVKKYDGIDYFKYIFGEHPIPMVNEWTEIGSLIKHLDNNKLDDLILSINRWYKDFMSGVSLNVKNIINEKLK